MKFSSALLASVYGGAYQQWNKLTDEEKEARRVSCDAKTDETRATFAVQNGSWDCLGYGVVNSKVKCEPKCNSGFKPDWTVRPKKSGPRFNPRCGDPPTIVKRLV